MSNVPNRIIVALCWIMIISFSSVARPHDGEEFSLKQPDGTEVPVRIFGDEFYQDVESVEGFTLIRDKESGWICYAKLSVDKSEYISTGIVYDPAKSCPVRNGAKHIRISKESIRAKAEAKREELGELSNQEAWRRLSRKERRDASRAVDTIIGLTLLIDFPDQQANVSQSEIDDLMNKPGYNKYSNSGSVSDYFYDVSNKKLVYKTITTQYVRVPKNKSYYDTPSSYTMVPELVHTALNILKSEGFDFSQLSSRGGRFTSINVLYAGSPSHGWAKGLWPHKGMLNGSFSANGIAVRDYQLTNIGTNLSIGTIVHENGHMLFYWPDLYAYDGSSSGAGGYCVMSYCNGKTPQQPNAYYRDLEGWIEAVDITNAPLGSVYSHKANSAKAYVYGGSSAGSSKEFYYIESRLKQGWSSRIPDEGLLIWHVDENGQNTFAGKEDYVVPEQADGLFSIENKGNSGGRGDCFHAGGKNRFNDAASPSAKWHNGANSGIDIANISAIGSEMTFSVGVDISPFVQVTTPNGGELWEQYREYEISWTDNITEPVTIELKKGSTVILKIASSVTGDSYLWTVPTDLEVEKGYKIVVTGEGSDNVVDESDAPFSITEENIVSSFPYVQGFDDWDTVMNRDWGDWVPTDKGFTDSWTQLGGDDIEWSVWTGPTPSKIHPDGGKTGPDGGKKGSGNYIFIEASTPNTPAKSADFITPKFSLKNLNKPKLSMWLHMYDGADMMGTLAMDICVDGTWHKDVKSWGAGKGDSWFLVEQDLSDYKGDRVQFRFRGVTGTDWASDICIDDFTINNSTPIAIETQSSIKHLSMMLNGGRLNYSIPSRLSGSDLTIELYNLSGRRLYSLKRNGIKSGAYALDLSTSRVSLASGTYIAKMHCGDSQIAKSIYLLR